MPKEVCHTEGWKTDWLDFDERVWPFLQDKGIDKPTALTVFYLGMITDRLRELGEKLDEVHEAIINGQQE